QMIDISGLSVSYGSNRVLEGISAHVRRGTITGLVGANGSGKSTLVKAAVGLRSEEHTSELQSRFDLVCRLLLEKKKNFKNEQVLIITERRFRSNTHERLTSKHRDAIIR